MDSDSDNSSIDASTSQNVKSSTSYDDSKVTIRKPRSDKGVKKERTPAQKEATQKALAILKERREAKAREEKERLEKASEEQRQRILAERYEKKKQQRRKLPPAPSYVTVADMEKFKNDILGALPKEVYKAVEVPKIKKIVEPAPQPVVKETIVERPVKLTGSELLDAILFQRNR